MGEAIGLVVGRGCWLGWCYWLACDDVQRMVSASWSAPRRGEDTAACVESLLMEVADGDMQEKGDG